MNGHLYQSQSPTARPVWRGGFCGLPTISVSRNGKRVSNRHAKLFGFFSEHLQTLLRIRLAVSFDPRSLVLWFGDAEPEASYS